MVLIAKYMYTVIDFLIGNYVADINLPHLIGKGMCANMPKRDHESLNNFPSSRSHLSYSPVFF